MRRIAALCPIAVAVALAAPSSFAAPPTITPVENLDFTFHSICPFDVAVHYDVNREQQITFSNGNFLITGALKVTLTATTGKSLSVNVSGPARFVFDADGNLTVYAEGAGFGPGVLPDTLALGHGLVIFGPNGVETRGHFVDLCALLA
jgi:hypothetical protein